MNKTCELIRELRMQKGISAVQFSKIMGVSKASISKWEKDELPGIEKLYEIARYFRVTVQELLDGVLEMEKTDTRLTDLFDISDYDVDSLVLEKNENKLIDYYKKCQNILNTFLRLLPLAVYSELNDEDTKTYVYLLRYISLDRTIIDYKTDYSAISTGNIDLNQIAALKEFFEKNKYLSKTEKEWEIRNVICFNPKIKLKELMEAGMIKPFIEAFKILSQLDKDVYITNLVRGRFNKIHLIRDEYVFTMLNCGAKILKADNVYSTSNIWYEDVVAAYKGTITQKEITKNSGYNIYGQYEKQTYSEHSALIDEEYTSLLKEACQLRRSNPCEYYARLKNGNYDVLLNF